MSYNMNPTFRSTVLTGPRAVWTHDTDRMKFDQLDWQFRCKTNENEYENETLIGNWNEERFDIKQLKRGSMLPSRFSYIYKTTYHASHGDHPRKVPDEVKYLIHRKQIFPGHQPELDSPCLKRDYNNWGTTSSISYVDPRFREAVTETPKEAR